ncbi:MAG TPA: amidohydrolase family protein [Bdellovibrionota bacterium]|nr:amidohydrolase family protein [Bdellovibrionota bacterium]
MTKAKKETTNPKRKASGAQVRRREGITDFHVHVQPWYMFKPEALQKMRQKRPDADLIARYGEDPLEFIDHIDRVGIDRVCVVNYVSPDIMGFTDDVNSWVSKFCSVSPARLLAVGSVHPRLSPAPQDLMDKLCGDLGIRMIKIHPPHQLVFPNEYRGGLHALGVIYRKAEEYRVPVMIHTGTSIFPGARNKYGDPMTCDDIGVDFPNLRVVLAHGGRPLWMNTCFFLVRRHPNFFMDISGIPPKSLLSYFPRLEEIADKVLYGTDWPGPGVPDMAENLAVFESLPLSEEAKQKMLVENARKVLP